jgi:hypothetical protein
LHFLSQTFAFTAQMKNQPKIIVPTTGAGGTFSESRCGLLLLSAVAVCCCCVVAAIVAGVVATIVDAYWCSPLLRLLVRLLLCSTSRSHSLLAS